MARKKIDGHVVGRQPPAVAPLGPVAQRAQVERRASRRGWRRWPRPGAPASAARCRRGPARSPVTRAPPSAAARSCRRSRYILPQAPALGARRPPGRCAAPARAAPAPACGGSRVAPRPARPPRSPRAPHSRAPSRGGSRVKRHCLGERGDVLERLVQALAVVPQAHRAQARGVDEQRRRRAAGTAPVRWSCGGPGCRPRAPPDQLARRAQQRVGERRLAHARRAQQAPPCGPARRYGARPRGRRGSRRSPGGWARRPATRGHGRHARRPGRSHRSALLSTTTGAAPLAQASSR